MLGDMFSSFLHAIEFFFKARSGHLEVIWIDLCGEGSPPGMQGSNRGRTQTTEGFPDNVTEVCARNNLALHQSQWLLVGMEVAHACPYALATVNSLLLPDVCDAVGVSPLGTHPPPSLFGNWVMPIKGEVRAFGRASMLVAVFGHAHDGFRWREIPHMTLGKILAGRGIRDATSVI